MSGGKNGVKPIPVRSKSAISSWTTAPPTGLKPPPAFGVRRMPRTVGTVIGKGIVHDAAQHASVLVSSRGRDVRHPYQRRIERSVGHPERLEDPLQLLYLPLNTPAFSSPSMSSGFFSR